MYNSLPVTLLKCSLPLRGRVQLPASKSISNRLLIIKALSKGKVLIDNLSNANDSQVLAKMLSSDDQIMDVGDAGTAMRFLTAYRSISGDKVIMKGSARMHERPIGALVKALTELGGDIEYLKRKGYPPLKTNGFEQKTSEITIPGNISSQFLTAVILTAPVLPMGLVLHIEGKLMSRPYLIMTIRLLEQCGIEVQFDEKTVTIKPQPFQPTMITVESDWSSAGYWFALVACIPGCDITLPGLQENSLQGDAEIIRIAKGWGVTTEIIPDGLRITSGVKRVDEQIIDFSTIPDLAQTVAVVHALIGIRGRYTGLESLRIKETDRILALQQELSKFGARLYEEGDIWLLEPSSKLPSKVEISTYQDHRMAMAFSVLASVMDVTIENRDVTRKSYPHFWDDLKALNVELK